MGRNKKAKSDAVHAKKSVPKSNPFADAKPATSKKLNPFEVHVNKEKFQILGRTCKHDKGLPGVSRAKALKKRSQTLGLEYQLKNKTNRFYDNRIGKDLTGDELTESVMNARFMADQRAQKKHHKTDKFNLNDDEVLTHRGQTLEEIEQFRDERSDDEDVDDALDASFTEAAHFGGADDGEGKDRKTAIEEMIVEQKRRKMEISKEKDAVFEMTEKLDADFKDVFHLVSKSNKNKLHLTPPADDYDKLIKTMIFEPRGTVTDKLLSPEEQAKMEHERLEKLEQERLERMRPDGDENGENHTQSKHRSADDLDDGYFMHYDDVGDNTLTYDLEGNLGGQVNAGKNGENTIDEADNSSDNDDDNDSDSDDDDDEESDDDEDNNGRNNFSDLEETDDEKEEQVEEVKTAKVPKKSTQPKVEQSSTDLSDISDIPYIIKMPKNYDDFARLVMKHNPKNQGVIIERLIKCNNPKLDGINRENVVKLFGFILQYINEMFTDVTDDVVRQKFFIFSVLIPFIFNLIQLNSPRMSELLLNAIKEKQQTYIKNPAVYPQLDTVILFKLVGYVYSTSDFRHSIVTPCYVFMQDILGHARVRSRQDIAIGLFICTTALEYGQQSKRFIHGVFNFLHGIIYLCVPKRSIQIMKIMPPFESTGPMNKLLTIPPSENIKPIPEQKLRSEDLTMTTLTIEFKVCALNMSLSLLKDAFEIIESEMGAYAFAQPVLDLLPNVPIDAYPDYVRVHYDAAVETLTKIVKRPLTMIVAPEKKPKALRQLEPRFETVYDDKRRPKMSKQKEERAKLLQKIKREKKGAIREIRRDNSYLQELRIQKQIRSDKERHDKVKRIYQEASVQQGELNELSRMKKRKKF